ncbi:MAG: efflux RND transporter periplasmic adaptor subunit [Thermoanaerobaculia bacterium]
MTPRRLAASSALTLAVLALLLVGACGRSKAEAGYYCPMHPSYVSDKPGDCPICNMTLVPRSIAGAEAEKLHRAADTIYTCPMHPEIVRDSPGSCPVCHMDLVAKSGAAGERRVLFYRNPMDPTITSPVAKKDDMGMDYLPVYADEASGERPMGAPLPAGLAAVDIPAGAASRLGLATAPAVRERFTRRVSVVGAVAADERRTRRVEAKFSGWIEKLHANFTGEAVVAGRPLLAVYSPDLTAAENDYRIARQAADRFATSSLPEVRQGGADLLAAARRRLELLDVPPAVISALDAGGPVARTIDVVAPASGFVLAKGIVDGQRIEPGQELYTIVDLSRVWVEANVYEVDAPFVKKGAEATLRLQYDPASERRAPIAYVWPTLDVATRTLRVRFDVDNRDFAWRPGMYVDVALELGEGEGLVVPDSAILDTGTRQLAFVEAAPGRFEPREVRVAARGDGRARIASGLVEGERVAISANFLLDSESRLRGAIEAAISGARKETP